MKIRFTQLKSRILPIFILAVLFSQSPNNSFEVFMYFTDDEIPFGPNPSQVTIFGSNDNLDGWVHTNGKSFRFSDKNCPVFSGPMTLTPGSDIHWGACKPEDFTDTLGVSFIDTIPPISYTLQNYVDHFKENASVILNNDKMIGRDEMSDTLIMTEIIFMETGGFYATEWWYLIPPVMSPLEGSAFYYDSTSNGQTVQEMSLRLVTFDMNEGKWIDAYDYVNNYNKALALIVNIYDIDGNDRSPEMKKFHKGDKVYIESFTNDKMLSFVMAADIIETPSEYMMLMDSVKYNYVSNSGFFDNELVELYQMENTGELNPNVQFNAFQFFHNHPDKESYKCQVDGFHHFDYRYWMCSDRYDADSCVETNTGKSFVITPPTYHPYSGPEIIYIKGGQVLVHGVVKGQYTIVTDDSITYNRHDDSSFADQVWGNIWLTDDVVYADSEPNGAVVHPDSGGTDNILRLISGGNIIIGNTKENGARNSQYGRDIIINGALMSLHGGFLTQYWQNSVSDKRCSDCSLPNQKGDWKSSLGDGRGGFRNQPFLNIVKPVYTGSNDLRGKIHLWGSIAQKKRGYVKRSTPGPYNSSSGIGYDKDYHYDHNFLKKTGSIEIDSDKTVHVDFEWMSLKGETPFELNFVPEGNYRISLSSPGYLSFKDTVNIEWGKQKKVFASLKKIQTIEDKIGYLSLRRNLWGLFSGAFLGYGSYLKISANIQFDEYLSAGMNSGDLHKIIGTKDSMNKYAFGLGAACMLPAVYYGSKVNDLNELLENKEPKK